MVGQPYTIKSPDLMVTLPSMPMSVKHIEPKWKEKGISFLLTIPPQSERIKVEVMKMVDSQSSEYWTLQTRIKNAIEESQPKPQPRYFAVIVKTTADWGGPLSASTRLGEWTKAELDEDGTNVIRCIEITERHAQKIW